MKSSAEQVII